MYFGIYDGWKWEEVNKINPEIDRIHKETNKIMCIPDQETTEQVEKRIYDCVEKIAKENIGKNVLICSHGIAIETFLRKINNEKFTEDIELYGQRNTSINVLEYDCEKNKFKVLILNDFSHLK